MVEQLNLLPHSFPSGFEFFSDFITRDEEQFLIAFARKLEWENYEMHGVAARRKVYRFDNERPYPNELRPIILKGAEALKVNLDEIIHVLFTHYPIGAPIGWHRDAPMYESILGISLGSDTTLKLRLYDSRVSPVRKIQLPARSAYIISGESRWEWEHHIAPVKEERFSLTMRTSRSS